VVLCKDDHFDGHKSEILYLTEFLEKFEKITIVSMVKSFNFKVGVIKLQFWLRDRGHAHFRGCSKIFSSDVKGMLCFTFGED